MAVLPEQARCTRAAGETSRGRPPEPIPPATLAEMQTGNRVPLNCCGNLKGGEGILTTGAFVALFVFWRPAAGTQPS